MGAQSRKQKGFERCSLCDGARSGDTEISGGGKRTTGASGQQGSRDDPRACNASHVHSYSNVWRGVGGEVRQTVLPWLNDKIPAQ